MRTERIIRLGVLRLALWRVPGSLWMLVGFLLSWVALVPSVQAETIPATAVPAVAAVKYITGWSQSSDAYASCNAYLGNDGLTPHSVLQKGTGGQWYCRNTQNGVWVNATTTYTSLSCTVGNVTASADGYSGTCPSQANTYSCPAGQNWTLSGSSCTRPDCTAAQTRNSAGVCISACTLGPNEQIGTVRYGFPHPQPSGVIFCVNGCTAYPGGTGTISGAVKYQYALVNGAGGAASSCTAGTEIVPNVNAASGEPLSNPTVASCISSGQGFGTVNGVVVCTGPTSTVASSKETQADTPASGPAKTTETTTTTVCTGAGACTTTTTSNVTSGGSGKGGTGPGSSTTPGDGTEKAQTKADFCQENPSDKACKVETQGAPATVAGLYSKGSRTVGDALADFRGGVLGSPIVSAATGYLAASIPSGTCSGLSSTINVLGHAWTFDPGQLLCGSAAQSIYSLLGLGVLLAAGWVAFRIAIL